MGSFRSRLNTRLRRHGYQLVKLDKQASPSAEVFAELERFRSQDNWFRFCECLVLTSLSNLTNGVLEQCSDHGIDAKEWASGVEDELRFWWDKMSANLSGAKGEEYRQEFLLNFPFEFQDALPDKSEGELEILDIGCALKPAIGRKFGDKRLKIIAADPLARAYNALMDVYGIDRGYNLVFGVAEKTADLFGEGRFDFILAQNSIDHGYDPMQSFEQICKALKVGGSARFQHFENEAIAQAYSGFHQWNIERHDECSLKVWNQDVSRIVNFDTFGCEATVNEFDYRRFGKDETVGINVHVRKILEVH